MKLILKKAHAYLYIISVTFFYFLMYPLLYLFSRKQTNYKYMNKLRRAWGFLSSACVGIFYRFSYEVPFDRAKPYIICPNHVSNMDISAMSVLVKSDCSFMGKEELLQGIVTGLFFRTVDIPVNRESKMSSYRAFKKAIEKLRQGVTIIIFPEGGIAEDYPPKLQEFKNGPFRLAIESAVPIVPVTMLNTWQVLWDTGTKYGSRPGICDIFVHKPFETAHLALDDADTLRDEVHEMIRKQIGIA